MPVRHLMVLREAGAQAGSEIPAWVKDYALFLLDPEGEIAAWYAGAERIFDYSSAEMVGQYISKIYPSDDGIDARLEMELKRSITEGHFGTEAWCMRKDGARFWGNIITTALKDEDGALRGFATVVRDFSDRQERDRQLQRSRAPLRSLPAQTTVPGIVSGEFDCVLEANDAFLAMVGYTREDLVSGLSWSDLTPPEYFPQDELAHEEGLRFGACTPFEKQFTRKDGTRVAVLVSTAVLKISPCQWISFVQDLHELETIPVVDEEEIVEVKSEFTEIIGRSEAQKRILAR